MKIKQIILLILLLNLTTMVSARLDEPGGSTGNLTYLNILDLQVQDYGTAKPKGSSIPVNVHIDNDGYYTAYGIKIKLWISSIDNSNGEKYEGMTDVEATGYVSVGSLGTNHDNWFSVTINPYLIDQKFVVNSGKFQVSKVTVIADNASSKTKTFGSSDVGTQFKVDIYDSQGNRKIFAALYYDNKWIQSFPSAATVVNDAVTHDIAYYSSAANFEERWQQDLVVVRQMQVSYPSRDPVEVLNSGKSHAGTDLGLGHDWYSQQKTSKYNHGYDLLIVLSGEASSQLYGGFVVGSDNALTVMGGLQLCVGICFIHKYSTGAVTLRILHELHHTYSVDHITGLFEGLYGYVMSAQFEGWDYAPSTVSTMGANVDRYTGLGI